jgi:mono/diheme cytochrome c family protein
MTAFRLFILALAIGCGGCIPWQFSQTAHVTGRVLDLVTEQPVPDAKIYDKRYPRQSVTTSWAGTFDFPAINGWGTTYLMVPGPDITRQTNFVIEAAGYHTLQMSVPHTGEDTDELIYLKPLLPANVVMVDYATQVRPIFEKYCYQCHGNGRDRAGVRLDVQSSAMMHIAPGDPMHSDVYRSMTRSINASDRMPPVPHDQPNDRDIDTIKQWIVQGPNWPDVGAGGMLTTSTNAP